jgi:flagellar hook-associated protein 1 FlgK
VAFTDIQRNIDEALEGRLRRAIGVQHDQATQQVLLAQVEALFSDFNGTDVGTRLREFFHSFDELQNTPEDAAVRDFTISAGARVADALRSTRSQLESLGTDLNQQIGEIVERADQVSREIARLNGQITVSEAGRRGQDTDLRDRRDAMLRELAQYFDVTAREQPNGALNVYVGSEVLVQGDVTRGLVATSDSDGEFVRAQVRFADTDQEIAVRGGRLGGVIAARDVHAYGRVAALDQLATVIISEVNRIHADGQGLVGFRTVTGTNDVLATNVPLNSPAAGLATPPKNGSLFITVTDDPTNTPVSYRIDVAFNTAAPTTLDSLVQAINTSVTGVTASITSDRRLSLTAADGYSFTFGHDGQSVRTDTSGLLAALGINTFFSGHDAASVAVTNTLIEQPELLAAASVFLPGDGLNAGRLATLDSQAVARAGGVSINSVYNAIAAAVAIDASNANAGVDAADIVLSSLQSQKESISGVNLDEEAISLLKYERAFQGAARFVTVVDGLIDELVAIIR